MSDLFKKCDDIYRSVMIVSQRAKQIIDDREIQIDETEDVEDSIQFAEERIVIDDVDKPMITALKEYLDGELEWKQSESNQSESD
jgi:DNA-directed RNA polymerase subunit K/omega